MENKKIKAEQSDATVGDSKQTIEEKIAIRMKKCGNMVNENKGDTSFLSVLSEAEKKALSLLLKKCLQNRKK